MKYKIGDLVKIDMDKARIYSGADLIGQVANIRSGLYHVVFRSGDLVAFTEEEILRKVYISELD